MGYLTESDAIIQNATEIINTIYNTQTTHYLSGVGVPVLGTYFNYNDVMSENDTGEINVDHLLGPESPIRYNKIINCPAYGMNRDLVPELSTGDGNLFDLNIDIEVTLLPNAFKPSPYDYYLYRFGKFNERKILFRINNVQLSSIKSHSFYKVNMHMIEIDDDSQTSALERQVVKTFKVDLDRIGTNDNCVIEDVIFDKCKDVKSMIDHLVYQYKCMFYSEKYNSVIYREAADGHVMYDQYLTNFIIHSKMFELGKDVITIVVLDQDYMFRSKYNLTFYRAIETKQIKDIKTDIYYEPTHFTRSTVNPFAYYGEEFAYMRQVHQDKDNTGIGIKHMNYPFIENIIDNDCMGLNPIEASIVRYFNNSLDIKLFTDDDLKWFSHISIEYDMYFFELIPITIYLLERYVKGLENSY